MAGFNFGSLKKKMIQRPEIVGGPGGTLDPQPPPPQLPGGPGGTANPLPPNNRPMPAYDISNYPISGYGAAPLTNYGQTGPYGQPYNPQPAPQVPNTPFAPGNMPQQPPEYQPHTPFAPGSSPWLSMGNMGTDMRRFF